MKFQIALVIMIGGLMFTIASCRHNPLFDLTNPSVTDNCDPDTVYFVNDISPLIISNCAKSGCHIGSGGGEEEAKDLSSYEAIMNSDYVKPFHSSSSKMIESVTTGGGEDKMPPSPNTPLSSDQISMLKKWIDQGARNNECSGGACDTTNVTYSGTIAGVMDTYCNGCHSGGSASGGIDLTSYGGVAAVAGNGKLMGSVTHASGYVAMPLGGSWLPDCKIDELRIWVEDNYPNN